jgi:hypothetical protein
MSDQGGKSSSEKIGDGGSDEKDGDGRGEEHGVV